MINTRYNRQIILPDFGEEAQEKLTKAKVLVIGTGGLGCPALQYLAAAGVGALGIVDFDTIDYSNLHRQILFDEPSVGKKKAEIAKEKLQTLNSEIIIQTYVEKITKQNAFDIIESYDIVVDCTDNFPTRYLVNDVCSLQAKPLVYGSIYRYEGQVSVFNTGKKKINYRDLFPKPPQPHEAPNCNEAGVLGVLSGVVGTLQANETIKLITGIGKALEGELMIFNMLDYSRQIYQYHNTVNNNTPKNREELEKIDYLEICGISSLYEVRDKDELQNLLQIGNSILIDVRNPDETPEILEFSPVQIPLSVLEEKLGMLKDYETLIFVCQSGIRSRAAVELAENKYPDKKIGHIYNGIKTIV